MSTKGLFLCAGLALLLNSCAADSEPTGMEPPADPADPADLVFVGGVVETIEPGFPRESALAVRGDSIVLVGSRLEVQALIGSATVVVELGGRALLPGIVDPHTHILSDVVELDIHERQSLALENGITTLADASVTPDVLAEFQSVADAGQLRVRVGAYLQRTDNCGGDQGLWYEAHPPSDGFGERLRINGVKIFADGGTCGPVAASQEWIAGVGPADPFHEPAVLEGYVRDAHDAGYQVLVHAQGDLAVRDAQDAIAAVLGGGPNTLRHRIDHNAIVTADLLPRYGEIGIVAVAFAYFPTCAEIEWTDFWKENGEGWRALLDANAGAHIAWHGDDPFVTPLYPFLDLWSYVTRRDVGPGGGICDPEPWLASDAIDVQEALVMMTREAAYAINRETEVGTLAVGKLADLIVLTDSPLDVAPDEIREIGILATFVGGKLEYCGSAGPWCPE